MPDNVLWETINLIDMNRIKPLFMLILLLSWPLHGQDAGKIPLQTWEGKTVTPQDWVDGKTPFVVSFWFATCKYCFEEMDAVAERFAEWNGEVPFRFIGVCTDDARSIAKAKAVCRSRGWDDFHFYFDTNKAYARAMNVVSMPHLLLFDKNGKLVYTHIGYAPGDEELLYEQLLKIK